MCKTCGCKDAESFDAEERWYLSDPCYAIPDDRWGEFVDKLFEHPNFDKNKRMDIEWEVDGEDYIVEVWDSPGGDGVWSFSVGEFGVDAGVLAVIPEKVAMEGGKPFDGQWFDKKPTLFTDNRNYIVEINGERNQEFDAESFETEGGEEPETITHVIVLNEGESGNSIRKKIRNAFDKVGYQISPVPKKLKGLTYLGWNSNPVETFIYNEHINKFRNALEEQGLSPLFAEVFNSYWDIPDKKMKHYNKVGWPAPYSTELEYINEYHDAESFQAHDHSHIYPSEELTPSHSHSSETFKSSNNNNNIMAAESKFDKLSDKIAKQYRKKGMSAKEAKEIGNKTAYTIGRKKYGKAGMAKKARAGMRAESFEAKEFFRCKNCDYNVELEVEAVFEDGLCSNCLVKEGFQKEYGTHGKWMKNGEYAKKIKGATYEDYDAESFEADDDYVIVDRGNYRVRVHKKNLDRFNRSTMHKIHSDKHKEGLMYDEETSRWIPLEAESFGAEVRGHTLYPHNDCEVCGENFNKLIICDGCAYQVCDTDAKDNMVEFDGSKKGLRKKAHYCKKCNSKNAESFEAEGNPNKTTTSINPKFFVGKGDGDDLIGKGKFMKYNDALAKAQEVAEKEGKSRVVDNRGFALWTHDGQGLFQKGKSTAQAKKYYRAEEYSIGSGFRLGFGLGLGMLALSTVTTIAALAASTIDERQVEK